MRALRRSGKSGLPRVRREEQGTVYVVPGGRDGCGRRWWGEGCSPPIKLRRFLGNVPCPKEVFQGWDLTHVFVRMPAFDWGPFWQYLQRVTVTQPPWPSIPAEVRDAMVAIARDDLSARVAGRRLAKQEVEITRADATHALYTHDGREYECWLLGKEPHLHAPSNPLTAVMDELLDQVRSLAAEDERRQAGRVLRTCRAMGEADPHCARRLEEAKDTIPDDLGDGRSWLPWT